jgi:CheY-like chemotaxis protein
MCHDGQGGILGARVLDMRAKARARRVLIVEDDTPTGDLLLTAINDERGYEAVRVGTADEALAAMGEVAPDLLVLDIRLPGMSGLELYDRIRADARFRSIPVMFETGTMREHADELRDRGIAAYVKKPFDVEEVVRFVKRLVPPLQGHVRRPAG